MRKQVSALGVCLAIVGLLVAGCGSSDDGGGSGGDASVQEVNSTCLARSNKTGAEIENAYRGAKLVTEKDEIQLEVNVFVPKLITDAEARIVAIESLEVPDGDEAQVNKILNEYRQWIQKAKSAPFKLVVANDVFNKAREDSGAYGLTKCEANPFEALTGQNATL